MRFSPNPQNPVIVSAGWDKMVKVRFFFRTRSRCSEKAGWFGDHMMLCNQKYLLLQSLLAMRQPFTNATDRSLSGSSSRPSTVCSRVQAVHLWLFVQNADCPIIGLGIGHLPHPNRPHRPHRIHQHGHHLTRRLSLRIRRQRWYHHVVGSQRVEAPLLPTSW